MKLYKVIAHGQYTSVTSISMGYSTRAAAERVAAGLAQSGKAPYGASIESYEDEKEDDHEE